MVKQNKNTDSEKAYLTKRTLVRAINKGSKALKQNAIEVMGYTVVEKDGWVVKEHADGHLEKISKIEPVKRPQHFDLK